MSVRSVQVPAPPAGKDWLWTVPGQYSAQLISAVATLTSLAKPVSTPDSTANGHDLTYNTNMYTHETFGVTGPFGSSPNLAVQCNFGSLSAGYLGATANAGAFDVATFTFEAIVNCQNAGNIQQTILAIDDAGNAPTHFRCGMQISRPGNGIRAIASTFDTPSLGGASANGVWGHIAATWDGAQWVGYNNGVANAPVVGHAPTLTVATQPLWAFGDGISTQGPQAAVASLAYYSGALTAGQLAAHVAAIATSSAAYKAACLTDGPLVLWMLDATDTHGSRTVALEVTNGTTVLADYPASFASTAGSTFVWSWVVEAPGANQTATGGNNIVPIPPTLLPPGYTLGTNTPGLTTFDQWSNITVWFDDGAIGPEGPLGPYDYGPGASLVYRQDPNLPPNPPFP